MRVATFWRARWPALLGLAAIALTPLLLPNAYALNLLVVIGIYSIALLGLDVIKGYAGLLSLGQAGFMGVGAYTSAVLTVRLGWQPVPALLVALFVSLVIAYVMAIPCSRLSGFNLALVTLAFVIITNAIFLGVRDVTGGATGIAGVPPFGAFGLRVTSDAGSFWLVWIVFAALFWLAWGMVHSPVGDALRAIRFDELAAASNGINVFRCKTIAFLIAAGYASIAGSLFAHQMRFISPDTVNWVVSTGLVTMLVLGGEGTLWGVLLGASLLQLLPEVFNALQDYLLIVQGVVLILVMIYAPRGLAGVIRTRVFRAT